jgi:hypothetical protein
MDANAFRFTFGDYSGTSFHGTQACAIDPPSKWTFAPGAGATHSGTADCTQVRPSLFTLHASYLNLGQTSPNPTSKPPPVSCPECERKLVRKQELGRHILSTHLPCWIRCPYSRCSWQGSRREEFEKHLKREGCGPKPEREQYEIYDTQLILGLILKDAIPVDVAARYARGLKEERGIELDMTGEWDEPWGRQSKGR